jgi:hypothetical protein
MSNRTKCTLLFIYPVVVHGLHWIAFRKASIVVILYGMVAFLGPLTAAVDVFVHCYMLCTYVHRCISHQRALCTYVYRCLGRWQRRQWLVSG